MRVKKPQYLKNKAYPFSLPRHVADILDELPDGMRSKVMTEAIMEQLPAISGGDIQRVIASREIEMRDMVVDILREEECKVLEIESSAARIKEMLQNMEKVASISTDARKAMLDVSKQIREMGAGIKKLKYQNSLADTICERIYSDTEKKAKELVEV